MNKFFQVFAMMCCITVFAQNAGDYAAVVVPNDFKDFKGNEYNLRKILISKLEAKNYTVVDGDAPQNTACNWTVADLDNTSGFLNNKITLILKDCSGKEILKSEGKSLEKDFDKGYQEALLLALNKVPVSTGKKLADLNTTAEAVQIETPARMETQEVVAEPVKETAVVQPAKSSALSKAEIYVNGKTEYQKIMLTDKEFILSNPADGVAKAIFKESTKPGVYRVKLNADVQTIGYVEGNNLVVESPSADGSYKKEIFLRK